MRSFKQLESLCAVYLRTMYTYMLPTLLKQPY